VQIDILYRPANSLAQVSLAAGESVLAESGAMVGMSTNVEIQTQAGGFLGGLKRMFGGESFFRNTFTAQRGQGQVLLAHALRGDMVVLDMTTAGYFVTSSCFVASTPSVQCDTKFGGFRGFLSGEGLFVLKCTSAGPGQLLVGAFGGLEQIECDGQLVVDTGHLVAWDAGLEYQVGKSGSGWIASFLSGEGLVCTFRGKGRIWIQSRNPAEYGQEVGRLLPPRKQ
jgi:uncharacterized protein (TIGR00266 family)